MVESPFKPHDLTRIEDQVRVDDDALTAKLPGRNYSRNGDTSDAPTKTSLPERQSSRNRTVFKKAESYDRNFPTRAGSTIDKTREHPAEIRRIKTIK